MMGDTMEELIKKAGILIEALPYIQRLYGKTVVIKYGGAAMVDQVLKASVMEDITLLKYIGVNPVVVHGGGPDINKTMEQLNITPQFHEGLRVTDAQTMEVAQMVLIGKTNKEIVALINQAGGKAIGVSGIDGKLIEAEQYKTEINGVQSDIGYVGNIKRINSKVLEIIARDEYIPVVAPIGIGDDGHSYNINADTVAGEIASALKAEKLMLLTDVEGIRPSKTAETIAPVLTVSAVYDLIENGIIDGGMIPKVLGCVKALESGVSRTHILDGRIPHCILLEIFTDRGIGTMITKD